MSDETAAILIYSQSPNSPGHWRYEETVFTDSEEQRVCDGIKRRWRNKGGALIMRVPAYDEGALRAARLDGMRRAREAVVKIPCVGMAYHWTPGCNASISAIDRLIAEAEKGET